MWTTALLQFSDDALWKHLEPQRQNWSLGKPTESLGTSSADLHQTQDKGVSRIHSSAAYFLHPLLSSGVWAKE